MIQVPMMQTDTRSTPSVRVPPKVSVLVPVYNASAYLGQCLNSITRQTLDGLEIILLDDGSTDDSWKIIQAHAAKDVRIRSIRKQNSGYGDTLNQGISIATGEYIGIVEADDFAEPGLFATLYDLAREHAAEVVKCAHRRYWSASRTRAVPLLPKALCGKILPPAEHPDVLRMPLSVWSAIYQRSFLLDNAIRFLPTPGASYQDISFSFKVFTQAKRAFFIDTALINYRQNNTASSTSSREKVFCVRDEFDEIERFIHEKNLLSLLDIFYELRAGAYLWNMTRLRHGNRKIFLDYALSVFRQALALFEAGRIQLNARKERRLRLLIRYPALFLLKYRLLDPIRTGGRLVRAGLGTQWRLAKEKRAYIRTALVRLIAVCIPDREKRRSFRQRHLSADWLLKRRFHTQEQFVHVPGVVSWGGSFKTYFLKNNMPEKIAAFERGLDEASRALLALVLERMLRLPDFHDSDDYMLRAERLKAMCTPDEARFSQEYVAELPLYEKEFSLPDVPYTPETFFFHHGLRHAPTALHAYIQGKDFIDGGAFVGDSVLVFNRFYAPRHVYSFEISPGSREKFQETLSRNHVDKNICTLLPMGLSDIKSEAHIADSANPGTTLLCAGDTRVPVTDLDTFAEENGLRVGFIKMDIEGSAARGLQGAARTIQKDRPAISLAVYHTPEEFFETKPLLDALTKGLDYTIEFKSFHPFPDCMVELALFAYPSELAGLAELAKTPTLRKGESHCIP